MESPLRAGIDLLDPSFEKAFRGSRVRSKSNYKCESHIVGVVFMDSKTGLCGADPVENAAGLRIAIGGNAHAQALARVLDKRERGGREVEEPIVPMGRAGMPE